MELHPNQWGTTTKLSWNYVLTTHNSCSTNQVCTIMPTKLMPTFITNIHPYSIPKSYQTHHIQPMNHFIHATSLKTCFNTIIQLNMWHLSKNKEVIEQNTSFPSSSLKQKGLAQTRGFSHSGELLLPRRELEKGNNGFLRFLA